MGGDSNFSILRKKAGLGIDTLAELTGYSPAQIYRWDRGQAEARDAVIRLIEQHLADKRRVSVAEGKFTFIDLFAGIGGLRRGFDAIGGKCVFTSEWDKYSQQTYAANYACDHDMRGDITKVAAHEIPPHDVLLAGFPCQPFSIAGVSKKNALGRPHGFHDTQGTLFFDVERIIAHHRPKAFLLENVKNLVSHDKGRTFRVIYETLTLKLGYHVQFQVIDARGFVPQHRERIFIVGFRDDTGFSFADMPLPSAQTAPRLDAILHPEDGSEAPEPPFTGGNIGRVAAKYGLTDHLWQYLQNYAAKHKAAGNGFGFGLVGRNDVARTLSARYYKDGSEILVDRGEGKTPRRLTPRECARLMGFDAPGGSEFRIPVSDTQAYRQFGNAVVVPVVEAIARHMEPHILRLVAEDCENEAVLRRA